MARRGRFLGALVVFFVLVAIGAVSCGEQAPGPRDAQPIPDSDEFASGVVDRLPRYPRTEEVAPVSQEGDVVTHSLLARDTQPRVVIDFYRNRLTGWTLVAGPETAGTSTVWADWVADPTGRSQRLRITTTSSTPTLAEGQATSDETDVQIDIVLYPDDARRPPP